MGRGNSFLNGSAKEGPGGKSERQHQPHDEERGHEAAIRFRVVGNRIAAGVTDTLAFLDHSVASLTARHDSLNRNYPPKSIAIQYHHSVPSPFQVFAGVRRSRSYLH